jgi:leucyl-tRNA synthetase
LVEDTVVAIAQVDGKLRDRFEVPAGISEQELRDLAMSSENVKKAIGDRELAQVIVRAPKLVNIATK